VLPSANLRSVSEFDRDLGRGSQTDVDNFVAEQRIVPHTLAGATVLQIVPSLTPSPASRIAVNVAHALVRAGGRVIVAGEDGALAHELKGFGGEWLPYADTTFNPLKLRRNVEVLAELLARDQIDIVHARSAGAAWCAIPAAERTGAKVVTELFDIPYAHMLFGAHYLRALSSGDRIITHSAYDARPMIERYRIPPQRICVIPRSVDLNTFNPAAVSSARVLALRQAWGIPSGSKLVLTPGRVAPGNGQMTLIDTARILTDKGMRGVTFVFAGDDRRHPRHTRAIMQHIADAGVQALFRMAGHCTDMPAAFAAADIVVVPYIKPPVSGRVVAEAQAMARPVIASSVGALPECLLAPPRIANELRTGWVVPPGETEELARALGDVLTLDAKATSALGDRARQFAAYMFSPESVVTATLEVYNSLLQAGS
jgi:glycosyltransferase involved in cell wall biosynthesis